jgi:tetratricopeptide (TPR) repeat protein
MSKQKRTTGHRSGVERATKPKSKRDTRPLFVDLSDALIPLVIGAEEQAEQLRRAMVGWSNYITRLSARPMDRETAFLVTRAYLRRGAGYWALCDWKAAVSDLTQVITMQVGEAETNTAYLFRARAFDGQGADQEAIRDLTRTLEVCERAIAPKQAARISPALVAALYAYRALLYCRTSAFDLAAADCDRALTLDAECADAYSVRGSAYQHQGEAERALLDCNRSIQLEGRAIFYYRRALVHQQLRNYSQAFDDIDRALSREPANYQFNIARDELLRDSLGSLGLASPTKTQIAVIRQAKGDCHA